MLKIELRSDGTVDRSKFEKRFPPVAANSEFVDGVASKDIHIDPFWLRIYLPQSAIDKKNKVPVILFFPGGGFVVFSPASPLFHNALNKICARSGFIIVAVDYRKAPEHRLPAAFEDSFSSLKWLQSQASLQEGGDPWLSTSCDFSSCFLMGHSAGGIIVHQVALMACQADISPVRIRGLVSCCPSFGGTRGTPSELTHGGNTVYDLKTADAWRALALPVGAEETHPYVNFQGPDTPDLRVYQLPCVLLVIGEFDFMYDRQMEYCRALECAGKDVTVYVYKGYGHLFMFPEVKQEDLDLAYDRFIEFLHRCM